MGYEFHIKDGYIRIPKGGAEEIQILGKIRECAKWHNKRNLDFDFAINTEVESLKEVLEEIGFQVDEENKCLQCTAFISYSRSSVYSFMNTMHFLAPYIETDSYLTLVGEDSEIWMLKFVNGVCVRNMTLI